MKRVYFVRHGQSEANAGGAHGPETPLTAQGIEQAKYLGERARKLPIEVIFASDLLRAQQTAQYIADAVGKPVAETLAIFSERRHVTTPPDILSTHPEVVRLENIINERFGEEDFRHLDEENADDLKERALAALAYLDTRPEQHILVVSHAVFIRMLLAVALFGKNLTGKEAKAIFYGFKTENSGLNILEKDTESTFNKGWRVFTWNDHAHLG